MIFKGFGHGLNKPKAARAAMEQDPDWFNEHVFGDRPATTEQAPPRR